MSASYTAVGWNRQKRLYDLVVAGGVLLYLAVFVGVGMAAYRGASAIPPETLLIRGLGTCGLVMLHAVLWIGPLARLDPRLLPLLYNRRHLGVATFLVGAAHALVVTVQYHALGNVNPVVSLLAGTGGAISVARFPFELLGLGALGILFVMAATSHDFWLSVLTARVWKSMHMLVYGAYALLVLHVALGALQDERHPALGAALGAGAGVTVVLHLVAGLREARKDARAPSGGADDGFVDVCAVTEIAPDRARLVCPAGGERIAVFRYDGRISAVSNLCAHQNGPLGEGRVVDGCITCPWHGYQYRPGDGCSPPPFTEKIGTYRVRVVDGRVRVDPRPLPPGTPVEPARIDGGAGHANA